MDDKVRHPHIIVPIKQVPETSEIRMDEENGTLVREGVTNIINPLDLYAVEKAIQIKEQFDGTVSLISMGPRKAESALREALSMGCDTATLVNDPLFAGSDTWATSYVLSSAIGLLPPYDLLLFGERATDGDTGQVGPCVASFLGLPVITYVSDFTVRGRTIEVKRLTERGYERYEATLPVALTVVKEISHPRLPTLRGKQMARRAEIRAISNADLKLKEERIGLRGSPTRVTKIHKPRITRNGEHFVVKNDDDITQAADMIIRYLADHHLLSGDR
jgi:electron transfer flavoprotein beta subunit